MTNFGNRSAISDSLIAGRKASVASRVSVTFDPLLTLGRLTGFRLIASRAHALVRL